MPEKVDITIIGAGVVGLAIAAQVTKPGRTVYLLEKNSTFGLEQSSRNSETIHAGIYYDPGSLKARLCVEGNSLIYRICEQNSVACKKCGKIIIAADNEELGKLEFFYNKGRNNGAPLQMLSRQEMNRIEPNLKAPGAFLSPTTGVIDSYGLMRYFFTRAQQNGLNTAFNARVVGIEKEQEGYSVRVHNDDEDYVFSSNIVINSGGLYSDKIAEMVGIKNEKSGYTLHWEKGEYYSVSGGKNKLINTLIYPLPGGNVGIHVCFDVNWRLRLGPFMYSVSEHDYRMDDSHKQSFVNSSMLKALPFISSDDLDPESSGIMVLITNGGGQADFIIKHESDRGLPGFINLIGMGSPALTSSPAIANYVDHIVDQIV